MYEGFKLFFIGYISGAITTSIIICGCYFYRRSVQRTVPDGGTVGTTEQRQREVNQRLEGNIRTATELIQKAKNILDSGKHADND